MAKEYRRSLLGTAAPRLEYSNLEESIRSSRQMQDRLSQLSQFAFKDLTQTAQRQGQEYAVKNRPSLQQISDAVRKGEDVKALFAQPGTVFGDNARVMQAELFRQDVSQNLNNRIADVINAIDRGMYEDDANAFADNIQAEIDGIYNVLADLDPQTGLKFKAHGVTLSNTVYEKILGKQTEQFIAAKEAAVETQKQAYSTLLSANLIKSNGNFAQAVALTMSVKQDLFDAYDALPTGMTDVHYNDITALEQEVFKNSTAQIIQNTPKLRNNFDNVYSSLIVNNPPEELDFYRYLPEQTKMEIVESVQALNAQQYDIATKQYTLRERNAQQSVARLKNEFTRLENKTDIDDPDRVEKLKALDVEIERLSVLHPNSVSLSDWNSYKNKEYQDINEFDDDALEIRKKIQRQEFPDYPALEEYVLKNYPTKFTTPNEVSATFGKLFVKENESYIDSVAHSLVTEVAPMSATPTTLRKMKEDLVRRINNIIADNEAFNATVEDPSQMKSVDAQVIANDLKGFTVNLQEQQEKLNTLMSGMQAILNSNKLHLITVNENLDMNNESNKLSIKKRLSKKEYELFMQNYQQMQNMIEQINNQPRGVF
jgi:hypothetical protein